MTYRRVNQIIVGTALAGILAASQTFASTTNVSSWDFESYGLGTVIVDTGGVGTAGFTGEPFDASSNAAVVVAGSPAEPPNGYPLPGSTHSNVMAVNGDVRAEFNYVWDITNILTSPLACTNVIIDTLIQPGRLSFTPEYPTNIQFALFFNTNGNPVVAHSTHSGTCGGVNRHWSEITYTNFTSNAWIRVTVEIDYLTTAHHNISTEADEPVGFAATIHFYRVWLDGQLVTHTDAYEAIDFAIGDCDYPPSNTVSLNQWFLCADSGFASDDSANNHYFSGIEFSGAGKVDDTTISFPDKAVPPTCPYPPEYCTWINGFALSDDDPAADDDGDGATNWEEYLAGTDPSDENDAFVVIAIDVLDGSNCISWLATTNSGVYTEFLLYRATNLTPPIAWDVISDPIPRDATGINLFYDNTPPADVPSYYHPTMFTNLP